MIDPADSEERFNALAWLESVEHDVAAERLVAPFLDAAAVLSTFHLESLQPTRAIDADERSEALIELTNSCQPSDDPRCDIWQLRESARRLALRHLGNRDAMRAARAANPAPATDPLQEGIDLLINSDAAPGLDDLSLEQLLGVERAVGWLEQIVEALPAQEELTARIERARLLAPMRKIAGEGFVDREDQRRRLADYVGTLPAGTVSQVLRRGIKYVAYLIDQRPPLHLFAPGGMGKSALLARFILDHTDARDNLHPLPFVYLDFDRAALDPREPQTILEDSIRQLLIQFPDVDESLANLGDAARESIANVDMSFQSRGQHYDRSDSLVRQFCRLLEVIAARNDQPVLMMLDTLEEAEYQGVSAMIVTWNLLADLLRRVDRLRIVTAGRSPLPPMLHREPMELEGLPVQAAEEFVIRSTATNPDGPISPEDARAIVSMVGTVPLSLALAARVVLNDGVAGLRDTVGRRRLFSRIRAEQQQGMLFRRILNHVRAHDPVMESIANPGLILRRITPEIIDKVLAGPCELHLQGSEQAHRLFLAFKQEVGLIDPYREIGAAWHIQAVRRIMLPELLATLGRLPQQIHAAAAAYYHGKATDIERAEEIYHRLWLGTEAADLDPLWSDVLRPHLRGAFEELPPQAKIWLGDKLGIELDEELRMQASFDVWERQAAQRARIMIQNGSVSDALTALNERIRPPRPSPLYALEADALKLLGRNDEAREVLKAGLAAAELAADRGAKLPLLSRIAFLLESLDHFYEALPLAMDAVRLARELREQLEFLGAGAAVLRLSRKLEALGWDVDHARKFGLIVELRSYKFYLRDVRDAMMALVNEEDLRMALRSQPAVFIETTAELGGDDIGLLAEAVSVLGIKPEDLLTLSRYVKDDKLRYRLEELLKRGTSRGIGHQVAELVPTFPEFFLDRTRRSVEDSLHRTVGSAVGQGLDTQLTRLTRRQLSDLRDFVERNFNQRELELLAFEYLNIRLADIADPNGSFAHQVFKLVQYAEQVGSLSQLLASLERVVPGATASITSHEPGAVAQGSEQGPSPARRR